MATAKAAPKKTTSKKAPPKKAAPASTAKIKELEQRIERLEKRDIIGSLTKMVEQGTEFVKDRYAANPTSTILVGLGVLLVLMIVIG